MATSLWDMLKEIFSSILEGVEEGIKEGTKEGFKEIFSKWLSEIKDQSYCNQFQPNNMIYNNPPIYYMSPNQNMNYIYPNNFYGQGNNLGPVSNQAHKEQLDGNKSIDETKTLNDISNGLDDGEAAPLANQSGYNQLKNYNHTLVYHVQPVYYPQSNTMVYYVQPTIYYPKLNQPNQNINTNYPKNYYGQNNFGPVTNQNYYLTQFLNSQSIQVVPAEKQPDQKDKKENKTNNVSKSKTNNESLEVKKDKNTENKKRGQAKELVPKYQFYNKDGKLVENSKEISENLIKATMAVSKHPELLKPYTCNLKSVFEGNKSLGFKKEMVEDTKDKDTKIAKITAPEEFLETFNQQNKFLISAGITMDEQDKLEKNAESLKQKSKKYKQKSEEHNKKYEKEPSNNKGSYVRGTK